MHEADKMPCSGCQGTGKCLRCNGAGTIVQHVPVPIAVISGEVRGRGETSRTCPKCGGSGMCQTCKGTGKSQ